jgi:hypothetical protein
MHWSDCHEHQRPVVLRTVLVMNLFQSLVLRTWMLTHACLECPRTHHRIYTRPADARFLCLLDAAEGGRPTTPRRPATPSELIDLRDDVSTLQESIVSAAQSIEATQAQIQTVEDRYQQELAALQATAATHASNIAGLHQQLVKMHHAVLLEKNALLKTRHMVVFLRNRLYFLPPGTSPIIA